MLWIRIRMHHWKQDPHPDPHQSEKPDSYPLQRRIRICIEVKIQELRRLKMNALELDGRWRSQWRRGGSKWSRGRSACQWLQILNTLMRSRNQIRIRTSAKGSIRIHIKVKVGSGSASKWMIRIRIKVMWIRNTGLQAKLWIEKTYFLVDIGTEI